MPFGMTGGAYHGGGAASFRASAAAPPAAPIPNISVAVPSSAEAGQVQIDWLVSYTNTPTLLTFTVDDLDTTGTTASGSWTISNGGGLLPIVKFWHTAGTGGVAKFFIKAGAVQNAGVDNVESSISPTATITATVPTVNIGSPSPTGGEEGSAVIDWPITYTGTVTAYNLVVAEITQNGIPAGTWSVINGTTATPTVRFTSTGGYGVVGFDVLAGACQNTGVNNAASAASTYASISEDEGK